MNDEPPSDVYMVFAGYIDQLAVQRFFVMTSTAIQGRAKRLHLLIQTTGGNVQDGVCLYNYFRSLPADVVAYNVGSIASAGVIAYLGAKRRASARLATFMVHRAHASFQGANADAIQARIPSLIMDDARTDEILKAHVRLSPEQWATHKSSDLWLTADEAVSTGLATDISEFAPPVGSAIYNVLG